MQSIFDKLRVIGLSNVHTLLDHIKSLNSVGEYEQYVRDLETARDQLDDQAASHRSDVDTIPREIASLDAEHARIEANFNLLVDAGNEAAATPLGADLERIEAETRRKQAKLEPAKVELAKFDDAVAKINMTLQAAKGKLEELRDLEADAEAKKKAAGVLSGVAIADVPDTTEAETRMRRQAAVADNQLNRALNAVTSAAATSGAATLDSSVQARIEARKAAAAGGGDKPAA